LAIISRISEHRFYR